MSERAAKPFDYQLDAGMLIRAVLGMIGLTVLLLADLSDTVSVVLSLVLYVLVGTDVVFTAVRKLLKGNIFNEYFLMTIATVGAFLLGDMAEGVAVMLFYLVGEFFQELASRRSRHSIVALLDLRPDRVRVLKDGGEVWCAPEDVAVGDLIAVNPGERAALDGLVADGAADVDTQAITGEAVPRSLIAGDLVLAGFVALTGRLIVKVEKVYGESTASRILALVREAETKKASAERFISRFAGTYTKIVVLLAVLLGLFVPLATGAPFELWLRRALVFLVISCPCALVVSIPLTFFAGIGAGARRGMLVKGGHVLEALAGVERVYFDKTGTLTTGRLTVARVVSSGHHGEESLIRLAAAAERHSAHPVALALNREAKALGLFLPDTETFREMPGYGVEARIEGDLILVGNMRLMMREAVSDVSDVPAAAVHVAVNGRYAGRIELQDDLKDNAMDALASLRAGRIGPLTLLSGDRHEAARRMKDLLSLDEAAGELLPEDKARCIEMSRQHASGKTMFVGDGINDAPALMMADVGVAMGSLGKDAAIESADMVIMTDDLMRLPEAVSLGRATKRVAIQNLVIALGGKAAFLILGALGLVGIWGAVFADTGLALLTILNAARLFFLNPSISR